MKTGHRVIIVAMTLIAIISVAAMAAVELSTSVIHNVFTSTTTATGTVQISINWLYLAGYILLTIVIPFVVEWIKKKFPKLIAKAWMPVSIGALVCIATGLVTGQIVSWTTLATYLFAGISSGGIASSGRDWIVGK